jgi:N-acetylmuramoyl-L-alanine amidase
MAMPEGAMGLLGERFWRYLVSAAVTAGTILLLQLGVALAEPASKVEATDARLTADGKSTTFELTMSEGLTAQVFTLASPYRVILDLPDLTFRLNPAAGQKGQGLVSAFRYGLFAERKSRIVIDTTGPVKIASAAMTRAEGGKAVKLAVVLVPIDAAKFGAGTGATRPPALEASAESAPPENLEAKRKARSKPVVVIDPGHGGIDPGAMGANNVPEKTIVLAVAQQLKAALVKTGTYDVRMTRSDDVFVSLDRRLKFSYDNAADLFISLHADSIEEKKIAGSIRGATIYTLSDQASDEQARIMAEKENASDLIAGIESSDRGRNDQVKNILIDLLKRETSNFSADFSHVLAKRLGKTVAMSRIPLRSAAFKVLKQTHAPSVLVELGYISNQNDEQEMTSVAWQQKVAGSIAAAIQVYFSKRTAERP